MRDLILETDKMQIRIILKHLEKECETDNSLKNNIETKLNNTPLGMFNYIKVNYPGYIFIFTLLSKNR